MRLLPHPVVTIPKWWTSSLCLLLLALPAGAGRKKKPKPKPESTVAPVPAPAPKAPKSKPVPLFDAALPIDSGPIPNGLPNLTAQGCAGCHFDAHNAWRDSAHAVGWRSAALQSAFETAATPACTVCHLPLMAQSPVLYDFDGGDVDKPVGTENPGFSASLRMEGVTCAACHVRDGQVVGSRPPEEVGKAPHPLAWSKELGSSEGCAACHQLTWEGADSPFYNTYGEWKRSPHAKAGIGCIDCHGGQGAGRDGFDHGTPPGTSRALSVLLDLPTLTIVRGDDPIPLGIVVQNTGAGHAFPTGSPFVGMQLRVWLEGPPDKKGQPQKTEPFTHDFAREVSESAPWTTTRDTRLPAAGERALDTELGLEHGATTGDWALMVQVVETIRGEPTDRVVYARNLPVDVE